MTRPEGDDAPVFEAPWQAQIYAMAQVLVESGRVTPSRWADALGVALRARLDDGAPDTTETYFQAVTDAVETVLAIDSHETAGMMEDWRAAYVETPHGKPVILRRDR